MRTAASVVGTRTPTGATRTAASSSAGLGTTDAAEVPFDNACEDLPMMCQDMMKSAVKCVSPTTTVEEAAVMMRDEGVGFLPVCDAARHVIGTITDRDIT